MSSDQHGASDEDVALTLAAIEMYFAGEVARWEATLQEPDLEARLENPAEDIAKYQRWVAEYWDRLAHVRAGGRITDDEAAQVHYEAVKPVYFPSLCPPGTPVRRQARGRLEAVQRGLAALGYDLSRAAEPNE